MNTQKLIEALDVISKALEDIKNSLSDDGNLASFLAEFEEVQKKTKELKNGIYMIDGHPVDNSYTELLANRLAWSYSTMHPEYGIDSQIRNLGEMINGSKISYVLNWIKRKGTNGLEDFFKLNVEDQRKELLIALTNYEPQIREVFKKKFSYV